MTILFTSFGFLGGSGGFKQQEVTPEIAAFIGNLLRYTLENKKTRSYYFENEKSGTAAGILSFAEAVLREAGTASGEELSVVTDKIAGALAEAEQASLKRISAMGGRIESGSLVLALVRDEAQGLCAVLAKVDHSKWFDGESLVLRDGFPYDDEDIWKSAVIRILEEGGLAAGGVSVYMDRPAAYWTSGFLGLIKERSDEENTRIAFDSMQKLLARRLEGVEFFILWNELIRKMKTTSEMNYPDFIDGLLGEEKRTEKKYVKLREELLALPKKRSFDTQFAIDRKVLPQLARKQVVRVNDYVELAVTGGSYDPGELIRATEDAGGDRFLLIRCTEEKTFEGFKR